MAFILNPYDATLDLTDRDDRKLFEVGCKGLETKDAFDGKKAKYSEFVKLLEKEFKDIHVMCAMKIVKEWPATGKRPV